MKLKIFINLVLIFIAILGGYWIYFKGQSDFQPVEIIEQLPTETSSSSESSTPPFSRDLVDDGDYPAPPEVVMPEIVTIKSPAQISAERFEQESEKVEEEEEESNSIPVVKSPPSSPPVRVYQPDGSTTMPPPPDSNPHLPDFKVSTTGFPSERGICKGDGVNFRNGPSTTFSSLRKINRGTSFTIIAQSREANHIWYKVNLDRLDIEGWIRDDLVEFIDSNSPVPALDRLSGENPDNSDTGGVIIRPTALPNAEDMLLEEVLEIDEAAPDYLAPSIED